MSNLEHLGDYSALAAKLFYWFSVRLMKDCAKTSSVVKEILDSKHKLNLRTVRSRYATDWFDACQAAKARGEEEPPNPLMHKKQRMTITRYVEAPANSDDE